MKEHIDIFLSHDWPRNIAHHGDKAKLLREKTFLAREVCVPLFASIMQNCHCTHL